MSLDFASTDVSETVKTCEIVHPATREVVLTIDLLSWNSEKVSKLRRKQEAKRLNRNPARVRKLDPADFESDALDQLVAATVAWKTPDGSLPVWQGQALECNTSNVRLFYEKLDWLRAQVDRFITDDANFLDSSPESLATT